MITGIQDIYINVQDMDRALSFYRDLLGLTVTDEDPHFTGLSVGGVRVGLHWTGGKPVPALPKDAHGAHAGATITFRVEDAKGARTKLEDAGATVLGFSENPWGTMVIFEDPDGNVLKLMQP